MYKAADSCLVVVNPACPGTFLSTVTTPTWPSTMSSTLRLMIWHEEWDMAHSEERGWRMRWKRRMRRAREADGGGGGNKESTPERKEVQKPTTTESATNFWRGACFWAVAAHFRGNNHRRRCRCRRATHCPSPQKMTFAPHVVLQPPPGCGS